MIKKLLKKKKSSCDCKQANLSNKILIFALARLMRISPEELAKESFKKREVSEYAKKVAEQMSKDTISTMLDEMLK